MVEVQCNMSSSGQPELACSELIVVMVLQVLGNHTVRSDRRCLARAV
jgi:hypothetical protein